MPAAKPSAGKDTLMREYRSAGSLLMRYADHQVVKSESPEAIERLTQRKLRVASIGQAALVVWTVVQFAMLTNYDTIGERGWGSAVDKLVWLAFAAVSCIWLQRTKSGLREATARLVECLRGE